MAGFSVDRVGNKYSLGRAVIQHIQCSICHHIFNEPLLTQCGHTFCYHCLDGRMDTDNTCPECGHQLRGGGGEGVNGGEGVSVSRNLSVAAIINDVLIACENRKKGCIAVMTPQTLAAHHESCPHRPSQQSVANYEIGVKSEEVETIDLTDDQPSRAVIDANELPPLLQPSLRSTRSVASERLTTTIVETSEPIVPSLPPPPPSQSTGERSSGETPVRAPGVETKQRAINFARKARRDAARVGGVFQCPHCTNHYKLYQSLIGHCNKAHSRRSLPTH